MTELPDNIFIDSLIIVQALGSQKKEFEHFHPRSSELHSLKNYLLLFKHPVVVIEIKRTQDYFRYVPL